MILDGSIKKDDLKDKYVFWGIDGTLAPYRLNGHISDPGGSGMPVSPADIRENIYMKRKPSSFMQMVLYTSGAKDHFAASVIRCGTEMMDKLSWLSVHYPMISEPVFVWEQDIEGNNGSLVDAIREYCTDNMIDTGSVVIVSADFPVLIEAEDKGLCSYHISSFLDYD